VIALTGRRLAIAPLLLLGWAADAGALSCSITASDVAFGSIDPLAGAEVDVSADIQINCSEDVPVLLDDSVGVCIYLDAGDGGSDGTIYRNMHQGSETLPYNLYQDAARSLVWGSNTAFPAAGGQRVLVTLAGLSPSTGSLTVPVYGRVPAAVADRPVGNYLSAFAGGARIRYSFSDTIACDGVAGTRASNSFVVSGTLAETCAVEADDLAFGIQAELERDVDSTSQIRTSCSKGLVYAVSLGSGGGGDFNARRMVHGSLPKETVGYQLYVDSARRQIWGDGSGGTVTVGGTGTGSPEPSTVYGRVPPQATPQPGDYDDTVIVTVNY
jgi:spore coat protein U-like protein